MPSFKPDKPKTADRGKAAEADVQKFLDACSAADAQFDYLRLPDARSAMGRMKAMPADFEFFTPTCHGLLEVKETEHDFRLSRSKVTQLPMMKKRTLAGGRCFVVVFHSGIGKWRRVDVAHLDPGASSWDLSGYYPHSNVTDVLHGFDDDHG
jgi:hypothetical protein